MSVFEQQNQFWSSLIAGLATAVMAVLLVTNPVWAQEDEELPADLSHPFMKVDLSAFSSPAGIPELQPPTEEQLKIAELGRKLFFDPILSADHTTSCATCHRPEYAFSSRLKLPLGVGDREGKRHSPSLVNRHLGSVQFWDGRSDSLEDQALQPIESEIEMASSVAEVLKRLEASDDYKKRFSDAFADGITRKNLATALAGFQRILVNADSRIDKFVTARESVLTRSERQGLWLYESKGGCWKCHSGQNYSDEKFHNTGVSWGKDFGRFDVTGEDSNKGQFKTPTLRNVGRSAPYMHDGSIATLKEVVEFYNRGGGENPNLDSKLEPLNLTDDEMNDLVAFLKALDGRYSWEKSAVARTNTKPNDKDQAEPSYERKSSEKNPNAGD